MHAPVFVYRYAMCPCLQIAPVKYFFNPKNTASFLVIFHARCENSYLYTKYLVYRFHKIIEIIEKPRNIINLKYIFFTFFYPFLKPTGVPVFIGLDPLKRPLPRCPLV